MQGNNSFSFFAFSSFSSLGAYAFIETSSPRKQGDKARLVSTQFNGTASKNCFTFWYHMYGSSIGSLNLYQVVGNTETLIWTLSGNKGRQWFNGQVPVGNQAKYKVAKHCQPPFTSSLQ